MSSPNPSGTLDGLPCSGLFLVLIRALEKSKNGSNASPYASFLQLCQGESFSLEKDPFFWLESPQNIAPKKVILTYQVHFWASYFDTLRATWPRDFMPIIHVYQIARKLFGLGYRE